ncbi:hypothetical protein [Vibrio aquimaris]|uniref:Uncharacterized protein n=1 Tax=Vibrio aquimaris TaxID=2587862 RepID=A0A5P9CH57_9VIBR|nr:hypothetical protein [Vibrio aquimaris]QFT25027.1 hypothetical protein FIV01_00955 [Vibrio aquimaris]
MKTFHFRQVFISTAVLFIILFCSAYLLDAYLVFPFFAFFAYSSLIAGLLWALTLAKKRRQFIVTAIGLIFLGTFASVDILLASDEAIEAFMRLPNHDISRDTLRNLTQVLLVLVNIFTGSLAANVLFQGLCKTIRQ